jgi:hypothetical protein
MYLHRLSRILNFFGCLKKDLLINRPQYQVYAWIMAKTYRKTIVVPLLLKLGILLLQPTYSRATYFYKLS